MSQKIMLTTSGHEKTKVGSAIKKCLQLSGRVNTFNLKEKKLLLSSKLKFKFHTYIQYIVVISTSFSPHLASHTLHHVFHLPVNFISYSPLGLTSAAQMCMCVGWGLGNRGVIQWGMGNLSIPMSPQINSPSLSSHQLSWAPQQS